MITLAPRLTEGPLYTLQIGACVAALGLRMLSRSWLMKAAARAYGWLLRRFDHVSTISLLSIGTGETTYSLSPPGSDAGILYWARYIADVMGFSQTQGTEIPLEYLLGERYHTVNFDLPDSTWTLDGIQHMDRLFEIGRDAARKQLDVLTEKFFRSPRELTPLDLE